MNRICCIYKCVFVLMLIILIGCEGDKMSKSTAFIEPLSKVPESAWKSLSQKRIYFGHQSVGGNIIAGIGDIQAHDRRIELKISNLEKAETIKEIGFYHSYVGSNENPKSKVDDFAKKIENGIGFSADIAFFKFCYIDVNPSTNVAELFRYYKNTMEKLKNKFPKVTFIHFTMPLVKLQDGPKAWLKKIIGKPLSGMDDNLKRDEYNSLIVAEYGGKQPIFDLAKAESTLYDGTRAVISKNGKNFSALVPGYTYDDGHLNEVGRKTVAAALLSFLAQLPEK